jgi:hypothetical protein
MGAFATDQTLGDADLELLVAAQCGDKLALRQVCDRFQTPLLAAVLRRTGDWDRAPAAIEPLLERLCSELVTGQLRPPGWAARAMELAWQEPSAAPPAAENGSGLEGLGAIARVVKRRALRTFLPQLPLPELLALLLVYLEKRRPEEMAGLVAATGSEAAACLVRAHEAAQAALKDSPQSVGDQT